MDIETPKCADCGHTFGEEPELSVDQRNPCPSCGSTKRIHFISINETLQTHSSLVAKGRHPEKKRPFIEIFSGADFSYRFQKWMKKFRLIDRDKNEYEVRDPETGEIVHKTKQKLTEHKGHGSAKKKKTKALQTDMTN
ncbi:MAG: hypothetical protein EPO24_10580 [Bacteroidetes bacterium]|nr:MAG: hypothetical protein EPO24_10580 [Bacteroidota bacterium]